MDAIPHAQPLEAALVDDTAQLVQGAFVYQELSAKRDVAAALERWPLLAAFYPSTTEVAAHA